MRKREDIDRKRVREKEREGSGSERERKYNPYTCLLITQSENRRR